MKRSIHPTIKNLLDEVIKSMRSVAKDAVAISFDIKPKIGSQNDLTFTVTLELSEDKA